MMYLKSVVIGNYDVGKTSLLITYKDGHFPNEYTPTVADGIITETNEMQIGFFDTGGGEDYHRLRPLSYPQTDVFILCFSLANIRSFQELFTIWCPEVTHWCPNTPIILVGTKLDLRDNQLSVENLDPVITTEEGQKMAEDIGAVRYLECSSLLDEGIQDVFDAAISIATKNEKLKLKTSSFSFYSNCYG